MVDIFQARQDRIRSTGLEEGVVSEDKVYETEKKGVREMARKMIQRAEKLFLCSWVMIRGLS